MISQEFLGVIAAGNVQVFEAFHKVFGSFDDVTIVVSYRRFFDWWFSMYTQKAKSASFRGLEPFATELERDLLETPKRSINFEGNWGPFGGPGIAVHPTRQQVDLYRQKGFHQSVIFNYHDTTDLVADFFCQILGTASATCIDLRARKAPITKNVRNRDWEYGRLTYAFLSKLGISNTHPSTRMHTIKSAVQ